jgi:O-antigen ligase
VLVVAGKLDAVVRYLPFVGTVDAGGVDYRQRLWEVSFDLLMRSPMFGVPGYMGTAEMETLRQGQGIIDMVNTYMGVALAYGLVGLIFYVGPYVICLFALWRFKPAESMHLSAELSLVRSSLLGLLTGVLVMIATTSTVSFIGVLVWALLGLGLAGAGILERHGVPKSANAEARRPVSPRGA